MAHGTKYVLYARKSSVSEDRQVQSIDDQIRIMTEKAKDLGIEIVQVFSESASAKNPNERPLFEKMMKMIESKKADGILCWHTNRISRNPIDAGRVQWALQQGILKSIQTSEKEYLPEDNTLLLSIETSFAGQYSIDLRKQVLRGMQSKCEKGWYPGFLTQGYLHDKNTKTVIADPDTFDTVRQVFDLVLKDCYTMAEVARIVMDKYAGRFKRPGGKSFGNIYGSTLRKILGNIFYTGHFYFQGKLYEGKHPALITMDEYERVQRILTKNSHNGRHKKTIRPFAFTGMMLCGECGCYITAENKFKKQKSGEAKTHTYYHCSGKKGACSQKKHYLKEYELVEMIDTILGNISINSTVHNWALSVLKETHDDEILTKRSTQQKLRKQETEFKTMKDALMDHLLTKVISTEEYQKKMNDITTSLVKIRQKLDDLNMSEDAWFEKIEAVFHFLHTLRAQFLAGDPEHKREIFSALGQNYILKDNKLSLEMHEWLVAVKDSEIGGDTKKSWFEPGLEQSGTGDSGGNSDSRAKWCAR